MATKNSFLITENAITAVIDFTPITVRKDNPRYGQLEDVAKQALKAEREGEDASSLWDEFVETYRGNRSPIAQDMKKAELVVDNLEYKDGEIYYNGVLVHNAVIPVIRRYVGEGLDTKSLINFLSRLLKNPSFRSVEQLWSFIEQNGLSIDDDGNMLAYKVVRDTYRDKYSNKFDNSPGAEVKCDRNKVNDDPDVACAEGFHVGGWSYSGPGGTYFSTGDKVIICKVDPADVVSVPKDANAGKVRCCRYVVVGDYKEKLPQGYATADGNEELANNQSSYNNECAPHQGARDNVDDELFDEDYEDEDYDDDDEDEDEDYDEDGNYRAGFFGKGDLISFHYKDEYRVCEVSEVHPDVLTCRLLKGDPSHSFSELRHRNFSYGNICEVNFLS